MKLIDFTQPGGFPLTQDELGIMQQSYKEVLLELMKQVETFPGGSFGSRARPVVLSGMGNSAVGGTTYRIAAGYYYYGGEIVRMPETDYDISLATSPNILHIQTIDSNEALTYHNGTSVDAITERIGSLVAYTGGLTINDTTFPFGVEREFAEQFGMKARRGNDLFTQSNTTSSGYGSVTTNISYTVDWLTGQVMVYGSFTTANAQNFNASPIFYEIIDITGINSLAEHHFSVQMSDYTIIGGAGVYIPTLNAKIDTDGKIKVKFIKPLVANVISGNFTLIFQRDRVA
ncbi:hypothetical protein EBZ39_04820 [bacterium]|nr:hypothetical protein [bacterium]